MRFRVALPVLALTALSPATAQDSEQIVTALTAQNHVGQAVTLCGHVAEFSCARKGRFMRLVLAPVDQKNAVAIQIADVDTTRFGRRVEDQFFGHVVCTRGTVEQAPQGLQVTVADPTHVQVQKQDRIPPPPQLAPEAHSACDPGVELPRVVREVKPNYTANALRERVQGAVLVRAVVKVDGAVGDMQVLRPLHPELDIEAGRAIKQWRFTPGKYMGEPAAVIVTMEMTFAIGNRRQ